MGEDNQAGLLFCSREARQAKRRRAFSSLFKNRRNLMPEQLKNLLIISVVVLALFILWALTIGVTYWDVVSRRKLSGIETAAWVALVVLLPGIGFTAYLNARLLGALLSPSGDARENPGRNTLIKRQIEPEKQTGTILAAEFLHPASPEVHPTQKTRVELERGARKIVLTVVAGPHIGVDYLLDNLPVKIGRGHEVSIPLDEDYGVSRMHAEIYEQSGILRIRDLQSTHGTKVNDVSITDKSLGPGDVIGVGESELMVGVQEDRK
jgi:hypothetical protein